MNLTKYIDYILYALLCNILVFDSITGFFLNKHLHLPLSQIVKFALLGLLIVRVLTFNRSRLVGVMYLFYSVTIAIFFYFALEDKYSDTLILYSKFLISALVFLYLKMLFRTAPEETMRKVDRIMLVNMIVLFVNVVVFGALGIGFAQYDDSVGSKGFFYAGNEMSAVLNIFFAYYMAKGLTMPKMKRWILSFLLLLLAVFCATKTGLLGFFILFVATPMVLKEKEKKSMSTRVIRGVLVGVGGLVVCGAMYALVMRSGMVERWQYFYQKNGVLALIFSGRIEYIQEEIKDFVKGGLLNKILGLGGERTVEMDFFDILLNFGYLGLVLVYSLYFYILAYAYRWRKLRTQYPFARWGLLLFGMLLFASSIAGHTVFSAMAGPFIGLAGALVFYRRDVTGIQEQKH